MELRSLFHANDELDFAPVHTRSHSFHVTPSINGRSNPFHTLNFSNALLFHVSHSSWSLAFKDPILGPTNIPK
jgi:hypothetical protein